MGTAIALKDGMTAAELRAAAVSADDPDQARRLLALAAIRDGMSRAAASRIGGMDRQTLRDWVHAYNADGIAGLVSDTSPGRPCKLSPQQKADIKALVEAGPDVEKDGVVRWRRVDLARVAKERFGVVVDEDAIGRVLRDLDFCRISMRPKHPEQKDGAIEALKKTSTTGLRKS